MKKIIVSLILILSVCIIQLKNVETSDIKVKAKLSDDPMQKIWGTIMELLLAGKPVRLAVIVQCRTNQKYEKEFAEISQTAHFTSELLKAFSEYRGFSIVERSDLDRILQEHKLTYTGLLEKGAIESGKILGVNYILYQDVFPVGNEKGEIISKVETGKIVEVETANILSSWRADTLGKRTKKDKKK